MQNLFKKNLQKTIDGVKIMYYDMFVVKIQRQKSPRLAGGIRAVLNLIKSSIEEVKKDLEFFQKKDLTTWKQHDKLCLSLRYNDKSSP